jgi:dTDP-4-dehydrorhamnose 3,5-epimerase
MSVEAPWLSISSTPLADLVVIGHRRLEDSRGAFSRIFCAEELRRAGLNNGVAQINHSFTRRRGSVRGLHFKRAPHSETKLVSCVRGEVFDVAVDLRRGSRTFLRWHAEVLSVANGRSLLIPPGFAHGFQALTDDCELIYLHSMPYAPHAEGGVRVTDPTIAIPWPLPFADISERDAALATLLADFPGLDEE